MNENNKLPFGEMWFDNSSNVPVQDKILAAAKVFHRKHGRWPKTLWVNPETLGDFVSPNGLKIVARKDILPHYFLVGPL